MPHRPVKPVALDPSLLQWLEQLQPPNREECRHGPRPCPHMSCIHHLYFSQTQEGHLILNHPDQEAWELEHTCGLDIEEKIQPKQALAPKPSKVTRLPLKGRSPHPPTQEDSNH